ncbi:MAG: 3-deoxy-D-manno-octulosonic acid transferase, partial [Rhodospirillales bacterium]|nr:3-deoxy-D-manno-octulosonic acid transferase [Rhodospirillales bacterium]
VLHGPHMMNFQQITREMAKEGCAIQVADTAALAGAVDQLLRDQALRGQMVANGTAYMDAHAQVVTDLAGRIKTYLKDRAAPGQENASA